MSELLGDRYQLQEVIARGGMATVRRAHDMLLGRAVAVKVLDGAGLAEPAGLDRFRREARTVAALDHPNIVAGYDFGLHNGAPYLVMELVEGDSLAAMLANGPLDVAAAVDVAEQTCAALAAAHAAGVVHRDVKPANILVTPAGTVKVCDFGIVRLQHAEATRASLTDPRTAVGTTDFMAPEQASGDPVDGRADLYALGCVLYAMLTGAPPFTGESPIGVVHQHLHRPPVPPASLRPDLPADLDALVLGLLAKSPADRPASADEVRTRLHALLDRLGTPGAGPVPDADAAPAVGVAPAVGAVPGAGSAPAAGSPAQSGPRHAARATAAVVSPTRTMPAVGFDEEYGYPPPAPVAAGRGPRLGLAAVAAIAVGAAILAGAAVAVLMAGRSPSNGAGTGASPGTATTAAAPRESGPAALVTALQSAVAEQARTGQLNGGSARDLTRKLAEIDRLVTKQDLDKAAEKVAELQDRLAELRKDERLTSSGYDALAPTLAQLAESLPATANDDD